MRRILLPLSIAALLMATCSVMRGLLAYHVDTKAARARMDLCNITTALKLFTQRQGRAPSEAEGLEALVDAGIFETLPVDPWDRPYLYELHGQPVVRCLGRDGTPGGEGLDADLSSDDPSQPCRGIEPNATRSAQ